MTDPLPRITQKQLESIVERVESTLRQYGATVFATHIRPTSTPPTAKLSLRVLVGPSVHGAKVLQEEAALTANTAASEWGPVVVHLLPIGDQSQPLQVLQRFVDGDVEAAEQTLEETRTLLALAQEQVATPLQKAAEQLVRSMRLDEAHDPADVESYIGRLSKEVQQYQPWGGEDDPVATAKALREQLQASARVAEALEQVRRQLAAWEGSARRLGLRHTDLPALQEQALKWARLAHTVDLSPAAAYEAVLAAYRETPDAARVDKWQELAAAVGVSPGCSVAEMARAVWAREFAAACGPAAQPAVAPLPEPEHEAVFATQKQVADLFAVLTQQLSALSARLDEIAKSGASR